MEDSDKEEKIKFIYSEQDLQIERYLSGELSAEECGIDINYGVEGIGVEDKDIIKLRPHHFETFFGRSFGFLKMKELEPKLGREEAERQVKESLKNDKGGLYRLLDALWYNPNTLLMIVPGPKDDVCEYCRLEYRGNANCIRSEQWHGWLGLEIGKVYKAGDIIKKLDV